MALAVAVADNAACGLKHYNLLSSLVLYVKLSIWSEVVEIHHVDTVTCKVLAV